jgi:hypothetical protein
MLRRAGPPALLLALGLASGVLVARLPPDLETTVVTRRHHGADPLLSAVLLRFGVDSLLHHPSRYFRPPILFPDPNPLRGTEPLVAEALLAVPFRLALGDRPAAVFTWVKIVTLALLTLGTGLMLKELGVGLSLCLLGGGLSVLVSTTVVFADRLQAVSLQWLPLCVLFAVRYWRGGRPTQAAAFAACLFLTVQASLYTTVMLLGAAPFLAPLLLALRSRAEARRRATGLALATAAAGALCLFILWPYVTDRADVAAYSTAAYASEKSWYAASLTDPLTSPPEYGLPGWRLGPASSWDGVYPGTGFVLLVGGLAALGLADAVRARRRPRDAAPFSPAHRASGRLLVLFLAGLAGAVTLAALPGASGGTWFAAGAFLWATLATWWVRLALWPKPATGGTGLGLAASAAALAALVFFLLGLGSPIRLNYGVPLLDGLFGPLSAVLPPLREMREVRRFLVPAGWAAVVAATLALELRLRGRPRALGPALAAVVLLVALAERLQADTRKAFVPPPPEPYELLLRSGRSGGLLELPFAGWGRIASVHRMLWQPSHGRPIVAGQTGLDPGWYSPARQVFNEFPSEESLLLLRAWGVDSVLDARSGAEPAWPEGVLLRGRRSAPGSKREWRLLDVLPGGDRDRLGPEPAPDTGAWERPAASDAEAAPLAADGSVETAAEVTRPEGLLLVAPGDVSAVELDYGLGRFVRVPPSLRVLGLVGDEWLDLTEEPTGAHLRARAANQLLKQRTARLVVRLRPGHVSKLRLVSADVPWDLPEVRVRVSEAEITAPR